MFFFNFIPNKNIVFDDDNPSWINAFVKSSITKTSLKTYFYAKDIL